MRRQYSRSTFAALWFGLGLTILAVVTAQLGRPLIGDHIHSGYPSLGQAEIATGVNFYATSLTILGALGILGWAVTIWSARRGSRWARWTALILALVGTIVALFDLLVRDTSGDTGLPPLIGIIGLLPCVAGAVAVTLMFTRSTTSEMLNRQSSLRSPRARTT